MVKLHAVLLGVLLGSTLACSKRSDDVVVFTGAQAEEMRKQCARDFPDKLTAGTWMPSPRELNRADRGIADAVVAALAKVPAADRDPARAHYYRQYAAFMRGERRVLYANGLRKAEIDQASKSDAQRLPWRTEVVAMCDVGPIYFGAVVDAESGAVDSFEFNGPYPPPGPAAPHPG